ncbi:uncharacterized protein LOC112550102 [Alligator sinensis]|uniref:Uncharacterized protein LOC112550102 n=1 Tax=Alligator sinensis TaxID=38654 RepID=A0A3Q0GJX6_ALLSI|nr:uncharacterized protein LOC112550102 [Alligator sinensis]
MAAGGDGVTAPRVKPGRSWKALALSHLRSARRPCWETLVSRAARGPEPGRATRELDHCKGPACSAPPLRQPQPGLRLKPDASRCSRLVFRHSPAPLISGRQDAGSNPGPLHSPDPRLPRLVKGDIQRHRSAQGLQPGSADRWTTLLIPAPGTGHPAVASTRCSACMKRVRWGSAQPPGDARSAAQPCRSLPQFRPTPKGPFLAGKGKWQHSLLILQPCQRGSALPQPASRCITPLPPGPSPFGQPGHLRCWRGARPLPKEPGPAAVAQRGAAISSPVKHGRGETSQGTGCWWGARCPEQGAGRLPAPQIP